MVSVQGENMKKTLMILVSLFLSSQLFAIKCTDKELQQFEVFLSDMNKVFSDELKAAQNEKDECKIRLREGMLTEITSMQTDKEFKDKICEYAVDFCKRDLTDKIEDLLWYVGDPACFSTKELIIDRNQCTSYFPDSE